MWGGKGGEGGRGEGLAQTSGPSVFSGAKRMGLEAALMLSSALLFIAKSKHL